MEFEIERFLYYVETYQHFQLISGFSTKMDEEENTHHALDDNAFCPRRNP